MMNHADKWKRWTNRKTRAHVLDVYAGRIVVLDWKEGH